MATNHNVVIAVLATMLVMQALHDSRWFPAQAKPDAPGPKDQQQQPRSKPPTLSDRREASTPTTAVKGATAAKEAVGAAPLQKAPVIRARRVDVRNRKPARALADIPWRVLADVARDDGLDPQAICTKAQPYAGADHMDRVWLAMEAQLERNKASALCEGYNGTRIVLSSFLDAAYLPSFEGWALRLLEATPLRLGCFLIVALDDASAEGVAAHGLGDVCFRVPLHGTDSKNTMNSFKLDLLRQFARNGYGQLHVEQDVGFVKSLDPKFFSGEVDLACATWRNDLCIDANSACNLGTVYVGPKATTVMEFANGWFLHKSIIGSQDKDQNAFNEAVDRYYFNGADKVRCHQNKALRYPFVAEDPFDAPYRSLASIRARFRWYRVQVKPLAEPAESRMGFRPTTLFVTEAAASLRSYHSLVTDASSIDLEAFHMVGMNAHERLFRFNDMGYLNIVKRRRSVEQAIETGLVALVRPASDKQMAINLLRVAERLRRIAVIPMIRNKKCVKLTGCVEPASLHLNVDTQVSKYAPSGATHQSLLWEDSAYSRRILNSTAHVPAGIVGQLFTTGRAADDALEAVAPLRDKILWYIDNAEMGGVPQRKTNVNHRPPTPPRTFRPRVAIDPDDPQASTRYRSRYRRD